MSIYGWQLLFNSFFIIFEELTKIIQPLFISMVLVYFHGGIERREAIMYGCIISVCALIGGVLHHPYYFNSWRIGMKIRVACSGLMYRKVSQIKFLLGLQKKYQILDFCFALKSK